LLDICAIILLSAMIVILSRLPDYVPFADLRGPRNSDRVRLES
jgi:hypothetical protein